METNDNQTVMIRVPRATRDLLKVLVGIPQAALPNDPPDNVGDLVAKLAIHAAKVTSLNMYVSTFHRDRLRQPLEDAHLERIYSTTRQRHPITL